MPRDRGGHRGQGGIRGSIVTRHAHVRTLEAFRSLHSLSIMDRFFDYLVDVLLRSFFIGIWCACSNTYMVIPSFYV